MRNAHQRHNECKLVKKKYKLIDPSLYTTLPEHIFVAVLGDHNIFLTGPYWDILIMVWFLVSRSGQTNCFQIDAKSDPDAFTGMTLI
jgi:hypothetical protein